ncbi:hypothetical protein A7A08_00439 [Methyloligella halotolerans]|uniref:BON domain protein n=1 Tax=Methyloligella halotolerans TaxID=1177755 RepID=A0A1E2S2Q8_9HYPH|nr:hypothetical protein [Methyloligella halotolerans]ODA68609.1 hypothetical protein A7A08_00439 [Methyloligella halotolerans]
MSVRPTLLSFVIASLLPLLFVAGVMINQCRAEPEDARAEAAIGSSANAAEQTADPETSGALPVGGEASGDSPSTSTATDAGSIGTSEDPAEPDAMERAALPKRATPDDASDKEAADDAAAKVEPYRWMARRSDNKIKLRGAVPSEKDQRTVVGMAKAHFADLDIDDGMRVTEGAPAKEQWLGAVSFALKQLTHIENGTVRLSDVALTVDGRARSTNDFSEFQEAMHGPLPTGLSVQKIAVSPPVADPFVFSASLEGNVLRLAGNVPSEEIHTHLKDIVGSQFRGRAVDDQLEVASGAPEHWEAAIQAALSALSRLQEGEVNLSKGAVKIDGMAPDKSTATELSYQLKRDLPQRYRSSENIRWKEAARANDVAGNILPRLKAIADRRETSLPTTLPSIVTQSER